MSLEKIIVTEKTDIARNSFKKQNFDLESFGALQPI